MVRGISNFVSFFDFCEFLIFDAKNLKSGLDDPISLYTLKNVTPFWLFNPAIFFGFGVLDQKLWAFELF